jgi:hypothetical protein
MARTAPGYLRAGQKSNDLIRVSDESAAMPKSMPKIVEGEAGELQGGGRAPAGTTLSLLT